MDLTREIKENYIELNNQDIINRDSLVEAVLSKWPKTKISQDLWCRKELVFAEADRFLRAIKRPDPPPKEEQLDLPQAEIHPGYKRLQKRYGVIRKKEPISIIVEAMTEDELRTKQRDHEQTAHGHMEHADEIRGFREEKFGKDG